MACWRRSRCFSAAIAITISNSIREKAAAAAL
jgi:hypothetical protein